MASRWDVIVLGAGIVGLCSALQLQSYGRRVILVDRLGHAGRETSFGNAGLIEAASMYPYTFPRSLKKLLHYARNRSPDMHYQLKSLPKIAPWLWRYFRASEPAQAERSMRALLPLTRACVLEHELLMEAAGAGALLRRTGWIKLFRHDESLRLGLEDAERAGALGSRFELLDKAGLTRREPSLRTDHLAGGVHYLDPASVSDPGALSEAYERLCLARGGQIATGDAKTLTRRAQVWQVTTELGMVEAPEVVLTLGPWTGDILAQLGIQLPLGIKRGYHMTYASRSGAKLIRPILDADSGYVLAPMARGIRLTTGVEFATLQAPATPVQLGMDEVLAQDIFPLGQRLDPKAWLGNRPCLPDMVPVIGPAPRQPNLWLNFGHQHLGLTLSAVSGRLLAQMMTGVAPFTDPAPYAATRFLG